MMNVHALTGSIGSGKSTVATFFRRLGAFVVSADELAREAVTLPNPAYFQVIEAFPQALSDNSEIDRKKLADIVFGDPKALNRLNSIIHPQVRALAEKAFSSKPESAINIYEIPLLFETQTPLGSFRSVIVVTAPEEAILKRVKARDGLSQQQISARLNSQLPQAEKLKKADHHISNEGSLQDLESKVAELFKRLRSPT